MPPDTPPALAILLISGTHERAHYAFMLAAGAGAIGRQVVLFATNAACHALCHDWRALGDAANDAAVQQAGVAGLEELREAAAMLGTRLWACDAGLRIAGVDAESLMAGVEVAGIPSFLSAAGAAPVITL